jgi:hypothetical protein
LDPFRSPLLRTSRLISLPPGTEMFQFPGFASLLPVMTGIPARRVAPFGHLRITACVPLPGASRSLPRPSSPLCAQASPTCLLSLDHNRCCQTELRALFQTSDVFLRKSHLNKGFNKSHDLPCTSVVKQHRPSILQGERGLTIESGMDRMCRSEATTRCFPPDTDVQGYSRSVKEVIQPQVPLRLPCYDFAPVTALAFGRLVPCGFRHGLRALTASMA